jgi:hypothetical protein
MENSNQITPFNFSSASEQTQPTAPTSPGFQFITFENAEDIKDPSKKRTARSYVIKRGLQKKRDKRFQQLDHFNNITFPEESRSNSAASPSPAVAIDVQKLDPFDTLPVDESKLQILLRHRMSTRPQPFANSDKYIARAQQAVEPVFSISDPYSFQSVDVAFKNGFADPAFSNATMCAILFAENSHTFTPDVLHYQGQAIQHINKHLKASSYLDSTIGAILLLVGIEVCLIYHPFNRAFAHPTSGESVPVKPHNSTSLALERCLKFANQGTYTSLPASDVAYSGKI